jgi:hypothetical protein
MVQGLQQLNNNYSSYKSECAHLGAYGLRDRYA